MTNTLAVTVEITVLRADGSFDGRATIFDMDGVPMKNILSPIGAYGALVAAKAYAAAKGLNIVEVIDLASMDGRYMEAA